MMGYTKRDIAKMKRGLDTAIANAKTEKEREALQLTYDLLDGLLMEGHLD